MAAAAAKVDGQDKVLAMAQRIVKSLATSKNGADDMILILSGFDNRLSTMNRLLTSSSSSADCSFLAAVQVIRRWESPDSFLWEASKEDSDEYLDAVDELISLLKSGSSAKELRAWADIAVQLAMGRLEDELIHLMTRATVQYDVEGLYSSINWVSLTLARDASDGAEDSEGSEADEMQPVDIPQERGGSSISPCRKIDFVLPEVVSDLKEIADRMVCAGYGKELCQAYINVRRDALDKHLSILGFERTSIVEILRTEWRALDEKMKKWIHALKIAVKVILMEEKRLGEQIFAASKELLEECFTGVAKGFILQILNFGDAISICQRSAEKIFRTIDMYEALANVIPDLQSLFSGEAQALVCVEADGILKRLGDTARSILMEFANSVQTDTSRKPLQGGDIHPLTRYVMNYVNLLVEYKSSLDVLLDGDDISDEIKGDDDQCTGEIVPSARKILLLISYLEFNLEMKSKNYEDGGLKCIFLMNNLFYIVQKVKESKLLIVLGDHWLRERREKIKQYAISYLRASWGKTLSCLKGDGLAGVRGGIFNTSSKMAIKEVFKNFNIGFEEIYRNQIAWKVSDSQLREELRISISEMVIPAYRCFFGRFSSHLEGGRHVAKYIKYAPDELETCISDFFEGLPGLSNHLIRRKLSSHRALPSHGCYDC